MLQGAVSGRHGVHRVGEPDQQLQQALHPRPQDGHQAELQMKVTRRFAKISQSRRRPLLGHTPG